MLDVIETQNVSKKIPVRMRAVVCIFCGDQELMNLVVPFINFEAKTIDWNELLKLSLSPSQRLATTIAFRIWSDEKMSNFDFFEAALCLEPDFRMLF